MNNYCRNIGNKQRPHLNNTICLNDINRYFSSTTALDPRTRCQTMSSTSTLYLVSPVLISTHFNFLRCLPGISEKIYWAIRSNVMAYDGISRRMITTILDHTLLVITHIINFSLYLGTLLLSDIRLTSSIFLKKKQSVTT